MSQIRFALFARWIQTAELPLVKTLLSICEELEIECIVYDATFEMLKEVLSHNHKTFSDGSQLSSNSDVLVSLGGDGTILDAISLVKDYQIPVLGINFGRLGFLAATSKNEIRETVESIKSGTYQVVHRELIMAQIDNTNSNSQIIGLNEFTIQRADTSSMLSIEAYINGIHINTYWADGIIVATSTGSTGYSLSCGGPIIYPAVQCFVITPIAPHNLNVRPLVIPNDFEITFVVNGRSSRFLTTVDTRTDSLAIGSSISLKKAPFNIKFISLSNKTFFNALKTKLLWGMDQRN